MQTALTVVLEKLRRDLLRVPCRDCRFLQNLANAFEGDGERLEIFRLTDGAKCVKTATRIHQVVGPRAENGIDLVVAETFLFAEHETRAVNQKIEDLLFLLGRDGAFR